MFIFLKQRLLLQELGFAHQDISYRSFPPWIGKRPKPVEFEKNHSWNYWIEKLKKLVWLWIFKKTAWFYRKFPFIAFYWLYCHFLTVVSILIYEADLIKWCSTDISQLMPGLTSCQIVTTGYCEGSVLVWTFSFFFVANWF